MQKKSLICLLSLPVLWSCAGTGVERPVADQAQVIASDRDFDESFDPASLGEYENDESAGVVPKAVFDVDAFLAAGDSVALAAARSEMNGYRVQLVSTRDEEEARAIRTDAFLQFDRPVFLTFDSPYYKVRVGNFLSRFDAEKTQDQAIRRGFLDAWVVRTMIQPQSDAGKNEKTTP